MKRREFIESAATLTAVFCAGSLLPGWARADEDRFDADRGDWPRPRMAGGHCRDIRLIDRNIPATYEREIFGALG